MTAKSPSTPTISNSSVSISTRPSDDDNKKNEEKSINKTSSTTAASDAGSGVQVGETKLMGIRPSNDDEKGRHGEEEGDPEVQDFYGAAVNDKYRLKSELVARHIAEQGMGRFQWLLFLVSGFGWVVDNFWSQGITAVRPAVASEFFPSSSSSGGSQLSFSSVAYYVGLVLGASFWGTSADIIGRKPAFNMTLLIGGIFGCAVAGSRDFVTFCALWACIGTAAGGNVPVDSCLFLEFVPQTHQWLLVSMSGWWCIGQLIVSLLSWVFLANFSCSTATAGNEKCLTSENMGWRYVMICLGAMALAFALVRILFFRIPESPAFLLSRGRDDDAVEAVNYIARFNGKPETLSLDMLRDIDRMFASSPSSVVGEGEGEVEGEMEREQEDRGAGVVGGAEAMSYGEMLRRSFQDYSASGYSKLFAGRKMAQHSAFTFLIWLTVGIAYPLYFAFITSYLQTKSSYSANSSFNHTYMIYCIVSAVGVLGPVAAGFCVETRLGRRWMMAISAVLTGVFLFAYTTVDTGAADVGFQCATAILGNFEYAIMYAFTPESFPGPMRGTGTGIAATLLRIGGLVASFISTYGGYTVVPIYASAGLWILVGIFCLALPFETHGHASI